MVRHGFTLVEVLVALAVSALILSAAALSVTQVASYEVRGRTTDSQPRKVERLRRALSADLKGLRAVGKGQAFGLEKGAVDGRRSDRIAFVRTGSLYRALPGETPRDLSLWTEPELVVYACTEEGGSLTLLRFEADPASQKGIAVPVLRGLDSFSVDAVESRSPHAGSGALRVAPDLLRVRIGFPDGSGYSFYCGLYATHRLSGGYERVQ